MKKPITSNYKVTVEGKPFRHREERPDFTLEFKFLEGEARKCSKLLGFPKDLILPILRSNSDWEFILKVNALVDIAAKYILRHSLGIAHLDGTSQSGALIEFIDSLPVNGNSSILQLLEGAGVAQAQLNLVDSARKVRNAYAHHIKDSDRPLIELIQARPDASHLVRSLSGVIDSRDVLAQYKRDPYYLRFDIFRQTTIFLLFAHNLTAKPMFPRRPRRLPY
jgi:hypothetical protein